MNRHNTPPRCEALEPRVLLSADLEVTILSATGPAVVVPGDKGTIKVRIKNVGDVASVGKVDTYVCASSDTTFDWSDPRLGSVLAKPVNLAPGKSITETIAGVLPDSVTPGTYHMLAYIWMTPSSSNNASGNDTAVVGGTTEVKWQFGNVGGRSNVKLTLHDGALDPVVFTLTGPGTGTIVRGAGGLPSDTVSTLGTTGASTLTISTPKGTTTTLKNIQVLGDAGPGSGAIKSISAPTVDLMTGVSVDGVISKLALDEILSAGHSISLNASLGAVPSGSSVAITAYVINDCTVATHGLPIKSFTAALVSGLDLTAPWMGTMTVSSKDGGWGNLDGTIALNGTSPAAKSLGKLTASGNLNSLALTAAGAVGDIKARNWAAGSLSAPVTHSITMAGGLAADVTGDVGAVTTGYNMTGTWNCHHLGKVKVGANLTNATFNFLGAGGLTDNVLESLSVHNLISSCTITSNNSIGSISALGIENSNFLLGVGGTAMPTGVGQFEAAHTSRIKSLTISGYSDITFNPVASFINTKISAWRIDKISLAYADTTNATTFGFAAHSIGKATYVPLSGGASTTWGPMIHASDSVTIDQMVFRILE
ncbi:MAG: LEPR-XLL domain-containing protein [Planctomycetota bacterium]|nr:LEPR-XLL domain-containing protein [Planctomycetota bacterium]